MAITGRTPRECFHAFETHIRGLLSRTLTDRYHVAFLRSKEDERRGVISFRERGPVAVPIETRFGTLYVHVAQELEAEKRGRGYRLRTLKYWYRLQASPGYREPALVRWDYDRAIPRDGPCSTHVQMAARLPFGTPGLDLDKLHLPTGWTTIEDVIRFLIVDLGARPPCGDEWPDILLDSKRRFFDFASDA